MGDLPKSPEEKTNGGGLLESAEDAHRHRLVILQPTKGVCFSSFLNIILIFIELPAELNEVSKSRKRGEQLVWGNTWTLVVSLILAQWTQREWPSLTRVISKQECLEIRG